MASHQHPLAVALSLLGLLVAGVLSRSLADDDLPQKELLDPSPFSSSSLLGSSAPNKYTADARKIIDDLMDFLITYGSVVAEDRSTDRRMGSPTFKRTGSVPSKIFWSPLGHLPASARLGGGRRPQALVQTIGGQGAQPFRYG